MPWACLQFVIVVFPDHNHYCLILCAEILGHMLRNDKNLKGINLNIREFILSQYADDT